MFIFYYKRLDPFLRLQYKKSILQTKHCIFQTSILEKKQCRLDYLTLISREKHVASRWRKDVAGDIPLEDLCPTRDYSMSTGQRSHLEYAPVLAHTGCFSEPSRHHPRQSPVIFHVKFMFRYKKQLLQRGKHDTRITNPD